MALEEVSFYNTNGDEINISNLVNQMIDFYNMKLEVGETRITDFNEGSEIRNLLEAFAVGLYALFEEQAEATKIAFISTSYGVWLDKIAELPFINLPRITGEYAEGTVTFTLATAQDSELIIPAETIVSCSDTDLDFVTTQDCIISKGELSETTTVECLTQGEDGNVLADSVDTILSDTLNLELISVTNESAFEQGADEETDDEYRERILENVQSDGFGTKGYYQSLCENVEGVHDVLLIDSQDYTQKVLVNGTSKPTPSIILLEVLSKLTDLDNLVLSHSFDVGKPAYTEVSLEVSIDVTSEIPVDDLTIAMENLFDGGSRVTQAEWDGLNINETLSREDIISALQIFDNVINVTSITQDDVEVTTLTPANNGVLQLVSVEFTQTEV